MKYRDLRDFIGGLERQGELVRVADPVSPHLEMTALSDRILKAAGPALLFENPTGHRIPVLANLFGTPRRVALGMGAETISELRDIGHVLARLKILSGYCLSGRTTFPRNFHLVVTSFLLLLFASHRFGELP